MGDQFYINAAVHATVYMDTEPEVGDQFGHLPTEVILYRVRGESVALFFQTLIDITDWGRSSLGTNEFGFKENANNNEYWHLYLKEEHAMRFKLRWAR